MRKTRKAVKEKDKVSCSKSVVEHLEELRKRIIISVVSFFGLFMVIISVPGFTDSFGLRIMKLLQEYILNNIRGGAALNLVFLDPLEPAFTGKTGKHLGAFILGSEILFLLGAVFSLYFLIPASFNILIRFGLSTGAGPVLSMGKFFDMFFWMFLLFTLPFELPVLIGVLSKTGIVTVRMLGKIRKPAYLGLAIFCAAVTPDPTPFSMLILWGLLLILFEFGVFLSHIFEKGESKWV